MDFSCREAGMITLVLCWIISGYTLAQAAEMNIMKSQGQLDQNHEPGQEPFGRKYGRWTAIPLEIIVEVGFDVIYVVTGGQCLMKIYELKNCSSMVLENDCGQKECDNFSITFWVVIFATPQFFLAQFSNLKAISRVLLASLIITARYILVASLCYFGEAF